MPDPLGPDYEQLVLDLGSDREGAVTATLVVRKPESSSTAILYVHGFNDYFFQTHFADFAVRHGIDFYALDLRKYGRSLGPHQTPYLCRSLQDYFAEIDATVAIIGHAGHDHIILCGHSTGALTLSLWAASESRAHLIDGLILNSPYLSSGVPRLAQFLTKPVLSAIVRFRPAASFPGRMSSHYARSLHRDYAGEWAFNTNWKSASGTVLRLAWVLSIYEGQRAVRLGMRIAKPVLILLSDHSCTRAAESDVLARCDSVIDVDRTAALSRHLGADVTVRRIHDAMHDVFLSKLDARNSALQELKRWLVLKDLLG